MAETRKLRILSVDDDRVIRLLLKRFVESIGHDVIEAASGEEAVEIFEERRPDLVLMDMLMPGIDGIAAARAIKTCSGERWVPVIFLTSLDTDADLISALSQGGDDYITKPVNFPILRAKIAAFERSVRLNQEVREQAQELARYQDRSIDEQRMAQHLMERIVNATKLDDPMLMTWLSPAEFLSGDLFAAARTPGDVLHVMLADGVGHGLTAAINVLPVTQPFYSMTEKGFSIAEVAREINSKVRQILPRDRFIAAVLLSVDFVTNRIEIWNGGIPAVHALDRSGKLVQSWPSRHVPLGILPEDQFDSRVDLLQISEDVRLVLCSDGLIEAENAEKEIFGYDRLVEVARNSAWGQEIDMVRREVHAHLAGQQHHDDVSVAVVHVERAVFEQRVVNLLDPSDIANPQFGAEWRFLLTLGMEELRYFNTVPFVTHMLDQLQINRRQRSEVFLVLSELYTNALDHGVLGLSSDLKANSDNMDRYFHLREERLASMKEGFITVDARIELGERGYLLKIRIQDSGPGFDAKTKLVELALMSHVKPSGKGIALVRALCQSLHYNKKGNEVRVEYELTRAPKDVTITT